MKLYDVIIIGAGHNAKAHAIAYMPLVLSGVLMVFNGKYSKGFSIDGINSPCPAKWKT